MSHVLTIYLLVRFPIMIRECGGILPKAWGRLGYGREVSSFIKCKHKL